MAYVNFLSANGGFKQEKKKTAADSAIHNEFLSINFMVGFNTSATSCLETLCCGFFKPSWKYFPHCSDSLSPVEHGFYGSPPPFERKTKNGNRTSESQEIEPEQIQAQQPDKMPASAAVSPQPNAY